MTNIAAAMGQAYPDSIPMLVVVASVVGRAELGKLLMALSQGMFWLLALHADIAATPPSRGRTIGAPSGRPPWSSFA